MVDHLSSHTAHRFGYQVTKAVPNARKPNVTDSLTIAFTGAEQQLLGLSQPSVTFTKIHEPPPSASATALNQEGNRQELLALLNGQDAQPSTEPHAAKALENLRKGIVFHNLSQRLSHGQTAEPEREGSTHQEGFQQDQNDHMGTGYWQNAYFQEPSGSGFQDNTHTGSTDFPDTDPMGDPNDPFNLMNQSNPLSPHYPSFDSMGNPNDPFNPMNQSNPLSPYYQNPFSTDDNDPFKF